VTANKKAQEDAKASPRRRFILRHLATADQPVTSEDLRAAAIGIPEPRRPSAGTLALESGADQVPFSPSSNWLQSSIVTVRAASPLPPI
jgi:hypothetical protein